MDADLELRCDEVVSLSVILSPTEADKLRGKTVSEARQIYIELYHPSERGDICLYTIAALQRSAPGVSKYDRKFTLQAMLEKLLFPRFVDPSKRKMVKKSLLKVQCVIPRIKFMDESLKYLETRATQLKDLVGGNYPGTGHCLSTGKCLRKV